MGTTFRPLLYVVLLALVLGLGEAFVVNVVVEQLTVPGCLIAFEIVLDTGIRTSLTQICENLLDLLSARLHAVFGFPPLVFLCFGQIILHCNVAKIDGCQPLTFGS